MGPRSVSSVDDGHPGASPLFDTERLTKTQNANATKTHKTQTQPKRKRTKRKRKRNQNANSGHLRRALLPQPFGPGSNKIVKIETGLRKYSAAGKCYLLNSKKPESVTVTEIISGAAENGNCNCN